jgi:erythromycin esterase
MPSTRHNPLLGHTRTLAVTCVVGLAAAGLAPLAGIEGPPAPAEVSGRVVGPGGEAAPTAVVAVVATGRMEPAAVVVADANGAFAVTVPAGTYALTATHPRWVAAYSSPSAVTGNAVRNLRLAAPAAGFLLTGEVQDSTGTALSGAEVRCLRSTQGDIFVSRADGAGHYVLRLPSAPHDCRAVVGELRSPQVYVTSGTKRRDLVIHQVVPAPQAVIDWIRGQAIPLLTARPGHGFADLAPLRDIVGGARVVALGEATHGTREFFQMKHRLLEYLVSELGFTVFAIEANWPESEAVDEYVRTGRGDPAKALAQLYFWTWNTEEVLDLVRWMRQWNAVPGHRQVSFYGFDMQAGAVSADRLRSRLREIDPGLAAEVAPALSRLAADERASAPEKEYLAAVHAVGSILPQVAERLRKPTAAVDSQALVDRQYVRVLQQYTELRSDTRGRAGLRDEAMADNVRWIADVAVPGSRIVVWAHNWHVVNLDEPYPSMGHLLELALGREYLPVGFLFHHGGFQAIDHTGHGHGLNEFVVGAPPAGTLEDTFERAGWPLCLLDLRRVPASGAVAEWLRRPQQLREVGAAFSGENDMTSEVVLPDAYRAVVFVEATTRARPNKPTPP